MSGMSLPVGGLEVRSDVSGSRKRVFGILGRGPRGLIVTTDDSELWVIDAVDDVARLVGRRVIVEGTAAGFDRLKVDWIGAAECGRPLR